MNEQWLQIPKRIRELREILELPQQQLAQQLSITSEEYSLLENGKKDIPISLLYDIAAALGTDFTVLTTGDAPRMDTYTVVRRGEGVHVDRYPGYCFESLAFNFKGRVMEPMLVTLEEKQEEPALVTHAGQEYNLVLEGSMQLTIGEQKLLLHEGDCVYFNPMLPHGQSAVGGKTRFLTVITEIK